jgi:hypothetical protein
MSPGGRSGHSPSGRAHEQSEAHEERLRHGLDGLRLLPHGNGEGRQSDRATPEPVDEGIEHGLIDAIESQGIHFVELQRCPGAVQAHDAVAVDLRPVADPAQQPVGDPRRAAAAAGDFYDSADLAMITSRSAES